MGAYSCSVRYTKKWIKITWNHSMYVNWNLNAHLMGFLKNQLMCSWIVVTIQVTGCLMRISWPVILATSQASSNRSSHAIWITNKPHLLDRRHIAHKPILKYIKKISNYDTNIYVRSRLGLFKKILDDFQIPNSLSLRGSSRNVVLIFGSKTNGRKNVVRNNVVWKLIWA